MRETFQSGLIKVFIFTSNFKWNMFKLS
jgi:hypothetical protein